MFKFTYTKKQNKPRLNWTDRENQFNPAEE